VDSTALHRGPSDIGSIKVRWRPAARPGQTNSFVEARLLHCDLRTAAILRPSSGQRDLSPTCLTRPPGERLEFCADAGEKPDGEIRLRSVRALFDADSVVTASMRDVSAATSDPDPVSVLGTEVSELLPRA
jgi:hypothetical protein